MSFTHRTSYVNPRLGTYFGIFMSAFAGLALIGLIFEGLGAPKTVLSGAMLFGPLVLYATIGLSAFTHEPLDFYSSGRRVPAFYTGLVLAQSALGATGLMALSGAFFLIGFDALCIVIGGLAGFVVMAILLAPFLRKFGAFTLPSYLGRRLDSLPLRLVAGGVMAVPMLLLLSAELRMGAFAAAWLWDKPMALTIAVLVATLVISLAAGGMRSLSWASSAESIASLLALLVPALIVAVLVTNLPIPQLSAGPLLRIVGRAEAAQGLPIILPPALAFDMPGDVLTAIGKRFSDAFGSVGPLAFVIVMIATLAGVGGAPWLLTRVATTPGVYEARKSLGWATLLFGLAMLTLGAVAIFMRFFLMNIVTAPGQVQLPAWFDALRDLGIASLSADGSTLTIASFNFHRDAVLLSLPIAAELPQAVVNLAAAGIVAASLATAGALTVSLGTMFAEDVVYGLSWLPAPTSRRLFVTRLAIGAAAALGGLIAIVAPTDPLNLLLWALSITAASSFPVLVMSIWWKRLNAFGAIAGLATGFGVTVLTIIADEAGWTGVDSALAGAIGIPAGTIAAIAVALSTPAPGRHVLELLRDIRVPGGEILIDREMRIQRRQMTQRGKA